MTSVLLTASLGYRYFRNMGAGDITMVAPRLMTLRKSASALPRLSARSIIASSANYDYVVNDSWYFDVNASTTIAITDSISLVPFANVGYGHNMNWQFNRNGNVAGGSWGGWKNSLTGWTAHHHGYPASDQAQQPCDSNAIHCRQSPLGSLAEPGPSCPANGRWLLTHAFKSVVYGGVTLSVRF
jgi:hypothetical protein